MRLPVVVVVTMIENEAGLCTVIQDRQMSRFLLTCAN